MQLKRGLPRESCDFCHRRKIKCDRTQRAQEGHDSCSQCALRQSACHMNEATDKRIRLDGHEATRGDKTGIALDNGRSHTIQERNDIPSLIPFASTSQFDSILPHGNDGSDVIHHPNTMFVQNFCGLSRDNIFFLDQVFMDDGGTSDWLGYQQDDAQSNQVSIASDGQLIMDEQQAQTSIDKPHGPLRLDGVTDSNSVFVTALHCYFKFAAPWLPILLEDAFWEDYRHGRCSHALKSAIACRGMPFTSVPDKWNLQQQYAHDFRETFLETRSNAPDDGIVKLDDLEALALMVNFEYEDARTPPLHSNLGRLFLKHESLVLMLLQSRIQDRVSSDSGPEISLARARERRVLLYWHVYGFDAFHCLDRKQISLIPDHDPSENENLPQSEARDFLDALLGLAVIARKLLQRLCNNSAKRHGIEPNDVQFIYSQIYHWRKNICPPHLRHEEGSGITEKNHEHQPAELQKYTRLHQGVLWALEINCLMQIEAAVSEFGIKNSGNLQSDIIRTRVEYESLCALNDGISMCRWIDMHVIQDANGTHYSLVDLAPLALRNVCAGLCFWSCMRGIKSIESNNRRGALGGGNRETIDKEDRMNDHIENAKLLRDTAAKAISHRDTSIIIDRIDKQISLFKEKLNDSPETE